MYLVSGIQPYYSPQWVKLPENLTKIRNSQVHGNALKTILWENTKVGLIGTAGALTTLVRLPELWSVAVDTCDESGLQCVVLWNDGRVSYFILVFLLCSYCNVRMSLAAEGECFAIYIFSFIIIGYYRYLICNNTSIYC